MTERTHVTRLSKLISFSTGQTSGCMFKYNKNVVLELVLAIRELVATLPKTNANND
jgi:hypothetical protein